MKEKLIITKQRTPTHWDTLQTSMAEVVLSEELQEEIQTLKDVYTPDELTITIKTTLRLPILQMYVMSGIHCQLWIHSICTLFLIYTDQ